MKSLLFLLVPVFAFAQVPSGEEILKKVDENSWAKTRIFTSKMIVQGRRATRTITSKSWVKGDEAAFTEYLAPAREKGIKMLKMEDQLWTYSPQTDRIIRISGHMLRQSVMGSDLSYEDMMEDAEIVKKYDAKVEGSEVVLDCECWVLLLSAKDKDAAYQSRKVWVDKERYIILKEERYAKSGKLLKRTEILSVRRMGGRWVAGEILFRDLLKSGKGTKFIIESVEYNADIPDYIFSKASLRK
ncbi:outer membrane lipoprotein-sorting protein [candidate division KSB1 bacterium]|nr:outer membrane lipoprotein-sorting protein [candidate division KSB1 bacterium]